MTISRTLVETGCSRQCGRARTDDSRLPWDTEDAYGGWSGAAEIDAPADQTRTPVVFIHGNGRDACDWRTHARRFHRGQYSGRDLWAITFRQPTPSHTQMAEQLDDFISHVRVQTGADDVDIVAHSLGVTGVRHWLSTKGRFEWVNVFIGIAGANHGIPILDIVNTDVLQSDTQTVCQYLQSETEATTQSLDDLNEPDETPGDIEYYTVRGMFDPLFAGDSRSPCLDGAEQNVLLLLGHDGARKHPMSINRIYRWLE